MTNSQKVRTMETYGVIVRFHIGWCCPGVRVDRCQSSQLRLLANIDLFKTINIETFDMLALSPSNLSGIVVIPHVLRRTRG